MSGDPEKKASVIAIHGMGRTDKGYAKDFQKALKARLGKKADTVHFGAIYYQHILDPNENRVWKAMEKRVRWRKLRKFALYFLGDAAALETRKSNANSPYIRTQIAIARELLHAYMVVGSGSPVTFVAHSLGCQVLSNYLWDAQQYRKYGQARVGIWCNPRNYASKVNSAGNLTDEQLKYMGGTSMQLLYTTGCNIPMFMAGHAKKDIIAINPVQEDFEWHNFYDKDDVLGWPLFGLSDSYDRLVKDHKVNAASGLLSWLLKSWNPTSHGEYWGDKEFLDHLESKLNHLLA